MSRNVRKFVGGSISIILAFMMMFSIFFMPCSSVRAFAESGVSAEQPASDEQEHAPTEQDIELGIILTISGVGLTAMGIVFCIKTHKKIKENERDKMR